MQSDREIVASALVRIKCDDGSGSGVAVNTTRGLRILSCYHVVHNCRSVSIVCRTETETGRYVFSEFPATIEKVNKKQDLVLVILPEGVQHHLKPLDIAKDEPDLYETILAGGCPNRLFGVVVEGWLQGVKNSFDDEDQDSAEEYLFSGLSVAGSSGGALVNMQHELIGIISANSKDEEQNIYSLGWAISLKAIRRFIGGSKRPRLKVVRCTVDFEPDFEIPSLDKVVCHEWEEQDGTEGRCFKCGEDRNHPIHLGSSE